MARAHCKKQAVQWRVWYCASCEQEFEFNNEEYMPCPNRWGHGEFCGEPMSKKMMRISEKKMQDNLKRTTDVYFKSKSEYGEVHPFTANCLISLVQKLELNEVPYPAGITKGMVERAKAVVAQEYKRREQAKIIDDLMQKYKKNLREYHERSADKWLITMAFESKLAASLALIELAEMGVTMKENEDLTLKMAKDFVAHQDENRQQAERLEYLTRAQRFVSDIDYYKEKARNHMKWLSGEGGREVVVKSFFSYKTAEAVVKLPNDFDSETVAIASFIIDRYKPNVFDSL